MAWWKQTSISTARKCFDNFGSDFAPFVAALIDEEWDFPFTKQPANSPDLNINDLSFLGNYSQVTGTLAVEEANNNDVDGLIEAVQAAVVLIVPTKWNCSFLTLQSCLEAIIFVNGDKNCDIPHIGNKAALEWAGILPDGFLAAG
jgi:hypothetical protein